MTANRNTIAASVLLLGLGQQGKRVVQKIIALNEQDHKISLLGVFDPNPKRFDEDILPGKKLRDLFPETQAILAPFRGSSFELRGVTAIFDCSSTVADGRDNHTDNMEWALQHGFRDGVYAVEKPTTSSDDRLPKIVEVMKKRKVFITTDFVESFTAVKNATIQDIRSNRRKVVRIDTFRLSATQRKSVETNRLIVQHFGGAWDDKAHDPMHAARVIHASYGEMAEPQIVSANFAILEIASPNGVRSRVTKLGQFVKLDSINSDIQHNNEISAQDAPNWDYWAGLNNEIVRNQSDAYADVTWTAGPVTVRHVTSLLGGKENHLAEIKSWFAPGLQRGVAEATTKRGQVRTPESVTAAYGKNFENLEARVARIECSDGTVYVEQTYAVGGGFFSARINPDGTVDILYEGAPNAPENDGIMNWVRNALEASCGLSEPAFSLSEILRDSQIIRKADRVANRGSVWALDLGAPENKAFAEFMRESLMKADCW